MEHRVSWSQQLPGPVPYRIMEWGSQISFWTPINKVLYPQAIRWKHFSDQHASGFHFSTEARQIRDVSSSPLLCVIIIIFSQHLFPLLSNLPLPLSWCKFYVEIRPRNRQARHSRILPISEIWKHMGFYFFRCMYNAPFPISWDGQWFSLFWQYELCSWSHSPSHFICQGAQCQQVLMLMVGASEFSVFQVPDFTIDYSFQD